jgi:hypothetical protein
VASVNTATQEYLRIYLDDHWAAAAAGVRLARRLVKKNRRTPWGGELAEIAAEITEDETILSQIRSQLGVSGGALKRTLAVVVEMVSCLKPNGRVWRYTPLSRVDELETLIAGVASKSKLWVSLQSVRAAHTVDLASLEKKARSQLERLSVIHQAAARAAFQP